ncbi:uncharacterized protein [Choristoneura fumiferana]|uniref:uncharacterized protein n=1 Tax=Choristoneura fumiferana TaxID=7141 RepID=UPI003D15DAC1
MQLKNAYKIVLLSVIYRQFLLPTVCGSCALAGLQELKPKPLNENRRQWQYPGPARRPQNETTEEPFDPRKDNENFTGTPNVENQCTTKHKLYEITTTMLRVSYSEDCEYNAFYCMRAYDTGIVCGRTIYFHYETFQNYCLLDYVNCMERYDMWQVVHMGKCFTVPNLKDYDRYSYRDDGFLDQWYIID